MEFFYFSLGFLLDGNGHILSSGTLVGRGPGGFGFHYFGLYRGLLLHGSGGLLGGFGGLGFGGFFRGFFGYFGGSSFSRNSRFGFGSGENHHVKKPSTNNTTSDKQHKLILARLLACIEFTEGLLVL